MLVKKHPSGNEYIQAEKTWVRNFTKKQIASIQLDHMFSKSDYSLILKNEQLNKNKPKISDEKITFKKIVIVSDGFDFESRHKLISKFPEDVCVLAINKALNKWKLYYSTTPPEQRRTINAYVTNNPYKEALSFLPTKESKYYPTCISSIRTNHEFVRKYLGDVYVYLPTFENSFGFNSSENYYIDDYRNPVCAAIGLAYQFGVEKLMLLCCDDSFKEKRESAIKLKNELWTYAPLIKSHGIIDANFHWLKKQEDKEVIISDYSDGPEYKNAVYINNDDAACAFFTA
jgi:hypothetical protein